MYKFVSLFTTHYLTLISKIKPLRQLHSECEQISNGEMTCKESTSNGSLHYDIFKDEAFFIMVDRCFLEIQTMLNIFVESIPVFYSGILNKNLYCLIKDDLVTYFTSKFITGDTYSVLFTMSRVKTTQEERQLVQCIKKAGLKYKKFTHNGLSLLEDLYNQIHPDFRMVRIEPRDNSATSNIDFESRDKLKISQNLDRLTKDTTSADEICLKYDTGATKMNTLNMCQTPLEKVAMIMWVAESIKQDRELTLGISDKCVLMCADTMVSIFSYIIALSGNHLLFAHLYLANSFASKNTKDMTEEGYYLCTLEAALSLLCDYEERTDELLVSIDEYEQSIDKDAKDEYSESFIETAPTPTAQAGAFHYEVLEPQEANFSFQQRDDYIPKSFFQK